MWAGRGTRRLGLPRPPRDPRHERRDDPTPPAPPRTPRHPLVGRYARARFERLGGAVPLARQRRPLVAGARGALHRRGARPRDQPPPCPSPPARDRLGSPALPGRRGALGGPGPPPAAPRGASPGPFSRTPAPAPHPPP